MEQTLSNRSERVAEFLTGRALTRFRQLLLLRAVASLGRPNLLGRGRSPHNTLQLLLSIEDWHVLIQLRHFDPLNLWKYAKAWARLSETVPGGVLSLSFLDSYAIFRSNSQSFYTGDQGKPFFVMHAPGSAANLRITAARLSDIHGARYDDSDHWISVRRYESDEMIPIYWSEASIADPSLERLVEGYTQPIWVKPTEGVDASTYTVWRAYRLMGDALSYWLWQLTPSLKPILQPLGDEPLTIRFRLEDPSAWSEMTPPPARTGNQSMEFQLGLTGRTMHMVVPNSILESFSSEDNYGDRIVVSEILKLCDSLLKRSGFRSFLSSDTSTKIMDRHAPIGQKKKLVVVATRHRPALNPAHLARFRKLQEYDTQYLLDGLAATLGPDLPARGEVVDPREKTKVCNKIVKSYIELLRRHMSDFNWKDLLTFLIGQHESYWHRHYSEIIRIPTNTACFGEISSKLEDMTTEWVTFEATGTAIRTAIEFVAAEPPQGRQELSTRSDGQTIGHCKPYCQLGNYKRFHSSPGDRLPPNSAGLWKNCS